MKARCLILPVLLLPFIVSAATNEAAKANLRFHAAVQHPPQIYSAIDLGVYFGASEFEGVTYSFGTTTSAFKATPNWNESDDFPPLSPRKAAFAAFEEAKRLRPDVSEWRVETVTLDGLWNHWIYRVQLARNDRVPTGEVRVYSSGYTNTNASEIHLPLIVPVLMDGTAVHGVVSQR
jgi:hypothetical protein